MSVVKLRLARGGAKKRPYYYIVAATNTAPRDGRYIERIGSYNPMLAKDHADRVKLDEERCKHWLSVGAQPTDRVARFLDKAGLMKRENATTRKRRCPAKSVWNAKPPKPKPTLRRGRSRGEGRRGSRLGVQPKATRRFKRSAVVVRPGAILALTHCDYPSRPDVRSNARRSRKPHPSRPYLDRPGHPRRGRCKVVYRRPG